MNAHDRRHRHYRPDRNAAMDYASRRLATLVLVVGAIAGILVAAVAEVAGLPDPVVVVSGIGLFILIGLGGSSLAAGGRETRRSAS